MVAQIIDIQKSKYANILSREFDQSGQVTKFYFNVYFHPVRYDLPETVAILGDHLLGLTLTLQSIGHLVIIFKPC